MSNASTSIDNNVIKSEPSWTKAKEAHLHNTQNIALTVIIVSHKLSNCMNELLLWNIFQHELNEKKMKKTFQHRSVIKLYNWTINEYAFNIFSSHYSLLP